MWKKKHSTSVRQLAVFSSINVDNNIIAGGSMVESAWNAQDSGFISGPGRSPEKGMATTAVFLPVEFHGQRRLAGYSSWGYKESDPTDWTH